VMGGEHVAVMGCVHVATMMGRPARMLVDMGRARLTVQEGEVPAIEGMACANAQAPTLGETASMGNAETVATRTVLESAQTAGTATASSEHALATRVISMGQPARNPARKKISWWTGPGPWTNGAGHSAQQGHYW
jgi:hypothetical protein